VKPVFFNARVIAIIQQLAFIRSLATRLSAFELRTCDRRNSSRPVSQGLVLFSHVQGLQWGDGQLKSHERSLGLLGWIQNMRASKGGRARLFCDRSRGNASLSPRICVTVGAVKNVFPW
jgi:hypothetical protein